jgi:predicted XRE-type DNA-binding protein
MDTKLCSKCKKVKLVTEFNKRKDSRDKLNYRCRSCDCIVSKEFRDKNPDRQKIYEQKWKKNNKEKIRKYQREWQSSKRRAEGIPARGGWLKYRDKQQDNALSPKPIVNFINQYIEDNSITLNSFAVKVKIDHKRISDIMSVNKVVTEAMVDKILRGLDAQDQWHKLYPVNES